MLRNHSFFVSGFPYFLIDKGPFGKPIVEDRCLGTIQMFWISSFSYQGGPFGEPIVEDRCLGTAHFFSEFSYLVIHGVPLGSQLSRTGA